MLLHNLLFSALVSLSAATGIGISSDLQAGNILVDDHGMTLYRFTPDSPNTSVCYDACALDWPPVLVDSVLAVQDSTLAANLGTAARKDGTQQLTYKGAPLYYYVDDVQPGDTAGQGIGNVWFVVAP